MTEPRAMRAICGQPSSTMKPITGQTVELVTTDRKTSPPRTTRMPKKTSVMRESTTSQPWPSKPKGWPGWEPSWALDRSQSSGSWSAISEGQIEMITRNRMTSEEMMKTGLRRRSRQASDQRLRGLPAGPVPSGPPGVFSSVVPSSIARSMPPPAPAPEIAPLPVVSSHGFCSGIADPRVEYGVQEVDDQVRRQEDEDQDGDEPDDGLGVLAEDPLVELVADSVDVEDALGDDRPSHQGSHVRADEGHDGDERVAQQVPHDHPPPGQTLGDGGADVDGAGVLGDRGPGEPGDVGQGHGGQDESGDDELVDGRLRGHGRLDDAPLHSQQELEQEAGDERGDGDDDQGQDEHHGVDGPSAAQYGDDAEADPDDDLEDDGDDGQPDGDGEGRGHQLGDLLPVERGAEVPGEDVAHVRQVLLPDGLVEAELGAQLGGGRGVALAVAAEARDGVAHDVHHEEDQQRGAEEDGDHLQQPPDHITSHEGLRGSGRAGGGTGKPGGRCVTAHRPPASGGHLTLIWSYTGTLKGFSETFSTLSE